MFSTSRLIVASLSLFQLISAHTVITYPGWRGNNLHTNGTVFDTNGLISGGNNASGEYWPYGMQWDYPCGGMPTSTNRTKWPIGGGALALQPGWFQGHATALFYVNLGYGTVPPNMSNPMIPAFQIVGPTKDPYPGTFCLPQVPLPVNASVNVGDNATIQIIETAVHGAALYNCVDITFAEPEDVVQVDESNCFNSSDIGFQLVFTTTSLTSAATQSIPSTSYLAFAPLIMAALFSLIV